ncbi:MAG: hydrogenase maturation nickel metallochaperone HypA [Terriglobia bacterium]|jgi:hydrogenase nickel incorporation protein HypA/HybF
MHELSIANSILEAVRKERERLNGSRITKVGVRIGELAGVDPDALNFGFEVLVKDTEFEPLALAIEFVARRHECSRCGRAFTVVEYKVNCPACGSTDTRCIGGDELDLAYLEVEES